MLNPAINSVLLDARGSVKTVGQLVSVCAARLAIGRARGDVLAVRLALADLCRAFGWSGGSAAWLSLMAPL